MSSAWVEGKTYAYVSGGFVKVHRRYFNGPLEMIDFGFADGPRTARTLAPCVIPRVRDTLGGVTRPGACRHEWDGRVLANAGPFAGRECCEACGTPPDREVPAPPLSEEKSRG